MSEENLRECEPSTTPGSAEGFSFDLDVGHHSWASSRRLRIVGLIVLVGCFKGLSQ